MRQQGIRFLIAGVLGFAVDTGVLYLALTVGLGYFAGRAFVRDGRNSPPIRAYRELCALSR
jgi:hypothetical protein